MLNVDGDFQQRYQQAEQAYAAGQYTDAHAIAFQLLAELTDAPGDAATQAAVDGWRAFVALLLGNIELYGLSQPQAATEHYQLVLSSNPHETLADLARQGLEWSQSARNEQHEQYKKQPEPELQVVEPEPAASALESRQPLSELLRDPFLQGSSAPSPAHEKRDHTGASSSKQRPTAMPWLEDLAGAANDDQQGGLNNDRPSEPQPEAVDESNLDTLDAPEAAATADGEPEPKPSLPESGQSSEPEATPTEAAAPDAETQKPVRQAEPAAALESTTTPDLEPEQAIEQDESPNPDPEPEVELEDPMDVLRDSWLRVTVKLAESTTGEEKTTTKKGDGIPSPSLLQRLRTLLKRSDGR